MSITDVPTNSQRGLLSASFILRHGKRPLLAFMIHTQEGDIVVLQLTLTCQHDAKQAAFMSSGGIASLAALLQQRREPTMLAAVLAAVTAFVRAATAAAAGPAGRQGLESAAAVPECGRARAEPAGSGPATADPANPPSDRVNGMAAGTAAQACCAVSPGAATPSVLRTPALPIMLALDDGLVAAVVVILRRRTPEGAAEPDLALPALQLVSTIVTAKAAARQLIRCGAREDRCRERPVSYLPSRRTHARLRRCITRFNAHHLKPGPP